MCMRKGADALVHACAHAQRSRRVLVHVHTLVRMHEGAGGRSCGSTLMRMCKGRLVVTHAHALRVEGACTHGMHKGACRGECGRARWGRSVTEAQSSSGHGPSQGHGPGVGDLCSTTSKQLK